MVAKERDQHLTAEPIDRVLVFGAPEDHFVGMTVPR
jgi:hypothetical protein